MVCESLESEITRQPSIHPCFRVLCRDEGKLILKSTSLVSGYRSCLSDSHACTVMQAWTENFFHDIFMTLCHHFSFNSATLRYIIFIAALSVGSRSITFNLLRISLFILSIMLEECNNLLNVLPLSFGHL